MTDPLDHTLYGPPYPAGDARQGMNPTEDPMRAQAPRPGPPPLPSEVEAALDFFDEGRAGCTCPERCPWARNHKHHDVLRSHLAALTAERDALRARVEKMAAKLFELNYGIIRFPCGHVDTAKGLEQARFSECLPCQIKRSEEDKRQARLDALRWAASLCVPREGRIAGTSRLSQIAVNNLDDEIRRLESLLAEGEPK